MPDLINPAWLAPLGPVIVALVETHLKPRLLEWERKHRKESDLSAEAFCTRFEEYIERSAQRYSYLSGVIFPQHHRRRLEELYVPLTVQSGRVHFKIDHYHRNFIPEYQRVLITDTAGMGKSTLSRFLFLQCLRENAGIPILIELRKLSGQCDIVT